MGTVTFKGSPVHTSAEFPKKGAKAHDFVLVDKDLKRLSLKDFGHKKKVLSIVISLDTGVCALSTKKLNEWGKKHPDCELLLISADLPFAQKRFCEHEKIANMHTLSTMGSPDFFKDYGVLLVEGPLKGLGARALLVLDENNHILHAELVEEITHEPNYDKAYLALTHV